MKKILLIFLAIVCSREVFGMNFDFNELLGRKPKQMEEPQTRVVKLELFCKHTGTCLFTVGDYYKCGTQIESIARDLINQAQGRLDAEKRSIERIELDMAQYVTDKELVLKGITSSLEFW
jgi:hypothetical protein